MTSSDAAYPSPSEQVDWRRMFVLSPEKFHEAVYVVKPRDDRPREIPRPEWATYQIGCEMCDWWDFEGSRWRAFWRTYRHRCRSTT